MTTTPTPSPEAEHRPGCDALGGYGHGVGPCTCGASPEAEALPTLPVVTTTYTMEALVPGCVVRCWAQLHTSLPPDTALTLHAPAEAAIVALRAERDQALAEAKEIRARWNDAENEMHAEIAELRKDAERLDWLLPNLHPANFGMHFEWDTDAEFLAGWRATIDAARAEERPQA